MTMVSDSFFSEDEFALTVDAVADDELAISAIFAGGALISMVPPVLAAIDPTSAGVALISVVDESAAPDSFSSSIEMTAFGVPTLRYLFCVS
jgi:hypothetical protein